MPNNVLYGGPGGSRTRVQNAFALKELQQLLLLYIDFNSLSTMRDPFAYPCLSQFDEPLTHPNHYVIIQRTALVFNTIGDQDPSTHRCIKSRRDHLHWQGDCP
jgi:hypothetical protein